MAVTFPREDMSAPIPRITSRHMWEPMKTTKLDATARLTGYLLSSDAAPQPTIEDGVFVIPDIDRNRGGPRTRKILIYQEWAIFLQLLLDASPFFKSPPVAH